MARNLDIATLRSFVAVAETGGVTRAAHRLHLTQSGVSMQLKRLEESLGVALLARDGRGVALTRQGEDLLADAQRLIALNDQIWARMTQPEISGQLVLGMPYDIVGHLAPGIIKRFVANHPEVKVNLISPPTLELLKRFEDGDCDVIVTTEFETGRGAEVLARRPLVWVGARGGRAWRRRPIPLAFDQRCAFRRISFAALEEAGLSYEWNVDVGQNDALVASIEADLAVATAMSGSTPAVLEEVPHQDALPTLPEVSVNMYVAPGPDAGLAHRLAEYVRAGVGALDTRAAGVRAA